MNSPDNVKPPRGPSPLGPRGRVPERVTHLEFLNLTTVSRGLLTRFVEILDRDCVHYGAEVNLEWRDGSIHRMRSRPSRYVIEDEGPEAVLGDRLEHMQQSDQIATVSVTARYEDDSYIRLDILPGNQSAFTSATGPNSVAVDRVAALRNVIDETRAPKKVSRLTKRQLVAFIALAAAYLAFLGAWAFYGRSYGPSSIGYWVPIVGVVLVFAVALGLRRTWDRKSDQDDFPAMVQRYADPKPRRDTQTLAAWIAVVLAVVTIIVTLMQGQIR